MSPKLLDSFAKLLNGASPRRNKKNDSNNIIYPLGNHITRYAEEQQAGGYPHKPRQITLVLLPGNPDVHAPQAGDDVHGEHNGTQDGELSKDIGSLLLSLVHADVNLGEIVAV